MPLVEEISPSQQLREDEMRRSKLKITRWILQLVIHVAVTDELLPPHADEVGC